MPKLETKALDAKTWPAFARLVEASNGVWGGRKASPAFLFISTCERLGFKRTRLVGKHKWVVTRTVR